MSGILYQQWDESNQDRSNKEFWAESSLLTRSPSNNICCAFLGYSFPKLQVAAHLHHKGKAAVKLQNPSKKIIGFHSFSPFLFPKAVTLLRDPAGPWIMIIGVATRILPKGSVFSRDTVTYTERKLPAQKWCLDTGGLIRENCMRVQQEADLNHELFVSHF